MALIYKRCLLKISGESLRSKDSIYDYGKIQKLANQIIKLAKEGLQIAIVIGAGNIWRGENASRINMNKTSADFMGMLATIMNALALESAIKSSYSNTIVCSAIEVNKIAEPYYYKKIINRLKSNYIVILAAGTGNPYFTTDTAAALRATELKADVILMAKNNIDGVYSSDPNINNNSIKLDYMNWDEFIELKLNVIDWTAATLAKENKLKMIVFNVSEDNNIYKAAHGQAVCTQVE